MVSDTQGRRPGAALSAELVKSLRVKAGLSQEALAERMGIGGKAVISGWETGRTTCEGPSAELLLKLLGTRDDSELSAELENLTESVWRRTGSWGDTWRQVSMVPEIAADIDRDRFVALFPDAALPDKEHVHGFPFVSPSSTFGLGANGWVGVIPTENNRMPHYMWNFTRNASFAYREVPWETSRNSIVIGGHTHIGALLEMVGSATFFLKRVAPKVKLDPGLNLTLTLDMEGMQGRGMVGASDKYEYSVDNPKRISPDSHLHVSITRSVGQLVADPLDTTLALVGEAALLLRPDLATTPALKKQLKARVIYDQQSKSMRFLGWADAFI